MLGTMTGPDVVDIMASVAVDPDEADRADMRWAIQMEASHAFSGATKPLPTLWWLQQLPWRPEYVSEADRAAMEAERARVMAEFARIQKEKHG